MLICGLDIFAGIINDDRLGDRFEILLTQSISYLTYNLEESEEGYMIIF